jgi:glutathione S-transferase
MIKLFQPAPAFGLPNASPFCMKLEAFLRWQNIPFTTEVAQPDQGPRKKVPFVDINNERVGDSNVIIYRLLEELKIDYGDVDFTYGIAFQRVAEEHLYWALVYFRWMDDEVWPHIRDTFFYPIPSDQREAIASGVRQQNEQRLKQQGIGLLEEEDILAAARADLSALSGHLSQQAFLCGEVMTHFDLAVWSVLSQLLTSNLTIQLTPIAQEFPALADYIKRVDAAIEQGVSA